MLRLSSEPEEESAWISVFTTSTTHSALQNGLVRFECAGRGCTGQNASVEEATETLAVATGARYRASGHPPYVEVGQGNIWRIQAGLQGNRDDIKINGCRWLMRTLFCSLCHVLLNH